MRASLTHERKLLKIVCEDADHCFFHSLRRIFLHQQSPLDTKIGTCDIVHFVLRAPSASLKDTIISDINICHVAGQQIDWIRMDGVCLPTNAHHRNDCCRFLPFIPYWRGQRAPPSIPLQASQNAVHRLLTHTPSMGQLERLTLRQLRQQLERLTHPWGNLNG